MTMKRFFLILACAALAFACQDPVKPDDKPDDKPDTPDDTPKVEYYESITATLSGSNLKAAWEAGDAIQVYNVTQDGVDVEAKYELSAGAGTATGTFVPASGVKALEKGGKGYFAAYPYNEDVTFAQHNTFSITIPAEAAGAAPMFAYSDDAASISFGSFLGAIQFTLTGKGNVTAITLDDANTNSILSGNATINPKTGKVNIKNGSSSKHSITLKLAEKLVLEDNTSSPIVMEVPAGTLATGATVTLLDANNSPLSVVAIPAQTITAANITNVGDINFKAVLQTVDLSLSGLANCYVVPDVGKYKFPAVKGNDSSATLAAASVDVLWESISTSDEIVAGSIIPAVSLEEGYVMFETADPFKPGNAVIAAKDADGVILWSWHIWLPEVAITADTYGICPVPMMDRFLGALKPATWGSDPDTQTFGLFYQWGRKDPFLGVGNMESTAVAACAGVERTKNENQMTIDETIKNPTVFSTFKGDWNPEPDNGLWGGAKTLYDPCPPGYRVPTAEDCALYTANDSSYADDRPGWAFDADKTKAFKVGSPETVFPIPGYLNYSGSYDKPGIRTKIYYAPSVSEYAPCFYFYEGPVYKHSSGQRRGVAGSIRCVAIAN